MEKMDTKKIILASDVYYGEKDYDTLTRDKFIKKE